MATITSVGSGLWSAAGTWDSGVPANGDAIVISAGHVVEFNVDTSGFAVGFWTITVNGTLKLTRTAGIYHLKMQGSAQIIGTGTLDFGTLASPIPFAAKHTITGGTGWYINGASGLTMTLYGAEPTNKYIMTTALEPIGETVIAVNTDVTGDIWQAGDTVRYIATYGANIENVVIVAGGIAAGTITLSAPLVSAKATNAYFVLLTRNVQIIAGVTTQAVIRGFLSGKLEIASGQIFGKVYQCPGIIIKGGVFYATGDNVLDICNYSVITGGVVVGTGTYGSTNMNYSSISGDFLLCGFYYGMGTSYGVSMSGGTVARCFYGFIYNHGLEISGTAVLDVAGIASSAGVTISGGTFKGVMNVLASSTGVIVGGTFVSGLTSVLSTSYASISNVTLIGSTACVSQSPFIAVNTSFVGTEVAGYLFMSKLVYSESIDHNQVAGAYKAWTSGGITTKQAVVYPVGYTNSMQTVLANSTKEGWWRKEVLVGAGASVNIEMQLRKDASMTYLPRCIIFNKATTDPFAGGAGLHTFTMTDSIDTWESDTYTYTNTGTEDVTLVIRCQGMNATGNMYSALEIEQINVDLTQVLANQALIMADLNNPDKYKADVSGLATANEYDADFTQVVELLYSIMGGEGWTDETLVSIQAAIEAISGIDEAGVRNAIGMAAANLDTQLTSIPKGTTVYDGKTLTELIKLISAVLLGKLSGGGTGQLAFRDIADTKDRVIADIDLATGDRTTQTLDGA